MIENPEEDFLYKINANDRYNEMQKEAMNSKLHYFSRASILLDSVSRPRSRQDGTNYHGIIACIREIVTSRLQKLGLETLRLPIGASPHSPHVPILASPSLDTRSRVIVVFGEPVQDLGVWAYRIAGHESINSGSAVNFATAVLCGDDEHAATAAAAANHGRTKQDKPGLILTNPGQLVWHCAKERALSLPTWHAIPRRSAVEPPMKMTFRNKIPGNESWQAHVTYVFEEVLDNMVSEDTKIDIIGLAEGGLAAIRYLAEHCKTLLHHPQNWPTACRVFLSTDFSHTGSKWQPCISAIAMSNPLHDVNHLHPPEFAEFISTRCRAYLVSNSPLNQPVDGRFEYGCNCYSSGEPQNSESIIARAWPSMLEWLGTMHQNPELGEVEMIVGDEAEEVVDAVRDGEGAAAED